MAETDARQFLAALAGRTADRTGDEIAATDASYGSPIERAVAATEGFESATVFLAAHDLDDLEDAVERAENDLSARAEEGRGALETLRRLRTAAEGRQFQSGLSSPLGDGDLADSR